MRPTPRVEGQSLDRSTPIEVLLIGSNLDRERSIAEVITRLLDLASPLHVSRIMETPPMGLIDGGPSFLNLAVAMPWAPPTPALKTRLVAIEEAMGRDRRDAECSKKSRTADIDPVLRLAPGVTRLHRECLPAEPYARAVVLDLLAHLGLSAEAADAPSFPVVQIPWVATPLGAAATCLSRVARRRSA